MCLNPTPVIKSGTSSIQVWWHYWSLWMLSGQHQLQVLFNATKTPQRRDSVAHQILKKDDRVIINTRWQSNINMALVTKYNSRLRKHISYWYQVPEPFKSWRQFMHKWQRSQISRQIINSQQLDLILSRPSCIYEQVIKYFVVAEAEHSKIEQAKHLATIILIFSMID